MNVFAENLRTELYTRIVERSDKTSPGTIMNSVTKTIESYREGYSVVMLVHDVGILASRDNFEICPFVHGSIETSTMPDGDDHRMGSESVDFDILGFNLKRDVVRFQ